jgi:hypothetical protein
VNVTLHPPRTRLHRRHWPHDLLTTPAAECLAGLHRCAASIAEHDFLLVPS